MFAEKVIITQEHSFMNVLAGNKTLAVARNSLACYEKFSCFFSLLRVGYFFFTGPSCLWQCILQIDNILGFIFNLKYQEEFCFPGLIFLGQSKF